jgi:hypothetical protein
MHSRNVRYQERQGSQRDISQLHAWHHIPPCRCLVLRGHTEANPIGGILHFSASGGFAKRNSPYGLSRPGYWVTTARAQGFSIVIAGLDPAIHAENLLAQSLRAAFAAECHHGPPGQARWWRGGFCLVYTPRWMASRRTNRTRRKMSRKYMPLYVSEFQFRYNNRFNPDIFGTAISGC